MSVYLASLSLFKLFVWFTHGRYLTRTLASVRLVHTAISSLVLMSG